MHCLTAAKRFSGTGNGLLYFGLCGAVLICIDPRLQVPRSNTSFANLSRFTFKRFFSWNAIAGVKSPGTVNVGWLLLGHSSSSIVRGIFPCTFIWFSAAHAYEFWQSAMQAYVVFDVLISVGWFSSESMFFLSGRKKIERFDVWTQALCDDNQSLVWRPPRVPTICIKLFEVLFSVTSSTSLSVVLTAL